jgi:nitroimidazol reductase NimA-like FMN-containing flavoprotein (pyridoxamine 5'-phosphate oxidase superfamily)
MTNEGLDVLDEADCLVLLHSRSLGRVGVHIGDEFVVLPVYYAVMDGDIVFRTGPGTKLNAALVGTRVVFEVDSASPGWSVLVRGHAREIEDRDARVHAETLLGHDWPAGVRSHCVRIATERLTGRRLSQRT